MSADRCARCYARLGVSQLVHDLTCVARHNLAAEATGGRYGRTVLHRRLTNPACAWCAGPIAPQVGAGRTRLYCSTRCRKAKAAAVTFPAEVARDHAVVWAGRRADLLRKMREAADVARDHEGSAALSLLRLGLLVDLSRATPTRSSVKTTRRPA